MPKPHPGLITTNGQLIIGTTALNVGGTHLNIGTITSTTLTVGYSSPNITIEAGSTIPITFQEDVGSATALANVLKIVGGTGISTSGAGNTVTISFTGGAGAVIAFDVDANTPPGTDPVVATAGGLVTVTGAQVAAGVIGANVIRTDSLAANTYTIEIQRSAAVGATDSTNNGVSHFDNTFFTVDANAFVSANTAAFILSVNVDAHTAPGTDPVVPDASGILTVTGAQVAAGVVGANVIRTDSLAVNTYTIEIQRSAATAAPDSTANGVSHFDSAFFTVDGDGFVSLAGGGTAISFNVDAHTAPGTDPVVPDGSGVVTVTGAQVAAGVIGANVIRTDSLAINTYTIEIQRTAAVGASASLNNGVSHFDSAAFDVDANGFVQLNGGGIAITSVNVDAATGPGTDPVLPTAAGQITVTGAQVATGVVGTNVIRTDSLAANTYTIEIQRTTAVASTTAAVNGVSHFDSAAFDVDANGFVQLNGGGIAATSFNVDAHTAPGTDPVVPDATGQITITGAQVAAGVIGANVIRTDSLAANTWTTEIQRSAAVGASASLNNGVSHFNNAFFTVDSNGFVSLAGGGATLSFNVDANTAPGTDPVVPDGSGVVTVTGAQVAAGVIGANVIRTDSLAANTWTTEIQRSTAVAASASANNGVSHFDSSQFTVDANGFVQITGATPNPFTIIDLVDDFIWCNGTSQGMGDTNWEATTVTPVAISGHPGVMKIGNGGYLVKCDDQSTNVGCMFVGEGILTIEYLIRIDFGTSPLCYIGLAEPDNSSAEPSDGVYFLFDSTVNSGKWVGRTAKASVRSTTNSSITVVSGTFYKLSYTINAAATSVTFSINDVAVSGGALTTNFPTASIAPKLATNGTSTFTNVDLFHMNYALTSARY